MRFLITGTIVALLLLAILPAGATAAQAEPSCAEGPTRIGPVIEGTPCADTIVAPPGVAVVDGGGGADTIVPALVAANPPCLPGFPDGCHLGVGSQTFEGGPGDDTLYGERGNDKLIGNEGNDHLFGGIGDDQLFGGPGDDQLSGGFGADSILGEGDDDYIRGDATIDRAVDGGTGRDTLSFATGLTPGFTKGLPASYPGFPSSGGERGVYLDLGAVNEGKVEADNGVAPNGGGVDREIVGSSFEVVIGTPFSDYIAGSAADETIYGGGGADVLLGGPGSDTIDGGADGDRCESAATAISCENAGGGVTTREESMVSVGLMAAAEGDYSHLYLTGSEGADEVVATYAPGSVTFSLDSVDFDSEASGCTVAGDEATCALPTPLDSLVIAGMGGDDSLRASGFPSSTSVMIAGGAGNDSIVGGDLSQDVLADGAGNDTLEAGGGDDALLNNAGEDELLAGAGNDLFLSDSICGGDLLDGGPDDGDPGNPYRDNASWAKFDGSGVEVHLDEGRAGRPGPGGPSCSSGAFDALQAIEDLEGTPANDDVFHGDEGNNQLLGWEGADAYFGAGGKDTILANSGDDDLSIDCGGGGEDSALIDRHPAHDDPTPVGCERWQEADKNSFRFSSSGSIVPPLLEVPETAIPNPFESTGSGEGVRPPKTRIGAHPRSSLTTARRWRRVVFRFNANEAGASFRCRLDLKAFAACRSPRAYTVRPGGHAFRVYAIDAAGNRDRTPALFKFSVRRR